MNKEELFFKEHFKEIKQLADNNNKITLACKYIMLKEELKKTYIILGTYKDGFKEGRQQTIKEFEKKINEYFDMLYGRTNMCMFKKELPNEFKEFIKKQTLKGEEKTK